MAEGGEARRLTVTSRCTGTAFIEVSIVDSGRGIPPEDRARLFEPFFTTKVEGMGIGLLICQTVIEEHGGTLEVRSEFDRGTVVTFTVPLAVAGGGGGTSPSLEG